MMRFELQSDLMELSMVEKRLKMKCFLFFTYAVLSSAVSSLSTGREARLNDEVGQGEEVESRTNNKRIIDY
jgi:hypothetical protein